jgi:hypothetical protein
VPGTGILEDMEITKALFTQVIDQCGFPRTLVQAAFANNGQFAYYIEYENQQAQSVPEFLCKYLQSRYSWDMLQLVGTPAANSHSGGLEIPSLSAKIHLLCPPYSPV